MKTQTLIIVMAVFSTTILMSSKCEKDCQEKIKTSCVCDAVYDPVCGCNDKTYSNACAAECASIYEYIDGPCCKEILKPDCVCTLEYDPVCGCNGVTYSNACAASCASVAIVSQGECPK